MNVNLIGEGKGEEDIIKVRGLRMIEKWNVWIYEG